MSLHYAVCDTHTSLSFHSYKFIPWLLWYGMVWVAFVRKQKELSAERVTEQKHKDKEKIFRWRDSQLSVMFRTTKDFQTVYHIFCSVLGIFTLKVLTNEYFEESGRIFSFKALWWNFGGWWNQGIHYHYHYYYPLRDWLDIDGAVVGCDNSVANMVRNVHV